MRKGRAEIKGKSEEEKKEIRRMKLQRNKEKKEELKIENSESEKNKVEEKNIEFPYIEEYDPDFLLSAKNVHVGDPGKNAFITFQKPDGSIWRYTNQKHLKYSKRTQHQNKIQRLRDKLGIIPIETELSDYNSKTCDIEDYTSYCSKKLDVNQRLEPLYENNMFRQYKWYNYICRERRYSHMLKDVAKNLGEDAILVIGDASVGVSMRNVISTPNKTLKQKLKTKFIVLSIDEFRTSCINCHTHKRQIGNFKYKDQTNKTRRLHSVLTYKMKNNRTGCIHRDNNAVKNLRFIYDEYIEYLKGNRIEPRPEVFCRSKNVCETP